MGGFNSTIKRGKISINGFEVKQINNLSYKSTPMSTTKSTESADYFISKFNMPSFRKILVPDDGKEISNKALNHAIYVSNLSGAEIVILRVIGDVDKRC